MLRKATWLCYDQGLPCGREANTAKYLCAEAGFDAADRALQTHLRHGLPEEYHVARSPRGPTDPDRADQPGDDPELPRFHVPACRGLLDDDAGATGGRVPLDGRSTLVTGAGGGVGAAVAQAFAAAGAAVLVTDVDKDAAAAVADTITAAGGRAEPFGFDVQRCRGRRRSHRSGRRTAGGTLHILVNNAGPIAPAMLADQTEETFRRIVDIHLVGSFLCSHAAQGLLPSDGTGRIINVTSAAGLTGTIGQVNYGAAKAGIIRLTVAGEGAGPKVGDRQRDRPAGATAMTANIRSNEKLAAKTLARIPLGRWATLRRSPPASCSWPPTPPPTSPVRCCRSTAGR